MGIYINKGNSGFQQIRNSEYVDKSLLIAEVNKTLCTEQKFSCVTRCRRFGKSMAAKMLAAYYDHSCDSQALFADLAIAGDPTFEQHLNKYPVINAVEESKWTNVMTALQQSDDLLQATLDGDSETVARMVEAAHSEHTSILSYYNENSMACVLS